MSVSSAVSPSFVLFVYLHQRFRKENGLVVKSNEVLELDTASRNAITMA